MADIKIECPACGWQPDGGSYWVCSVCGCKWNTFETAARCPECSFQYTYTSCIRHRGGCSKSPLHLLWYKNLDEIVEELKEHICEPVLR
ncbi:MAG: hypothetical protein ABI723_16830 [Bacteroidia bacterium]